MIGQARDEKGTSKMASVRIKVQLRYLKMVAVQFLPAFFDVSSG